MATHLDLINAKQKEFDEKIATVERDLCVKARESNKLSDKQPRTSTVVGADNRRSDIVDVNVHL